MTGWVPWTCASCDGTGCDHVPVFLTPADYVIPAEAARRASWIAWEPGREEDRHG